MRILITGGDHTGKDSLAAALVEASDGALTYRKSSSRLVANLVPEWQDGRCLDDWWADRRKHRQEWIDAFDNLRRTYRPSIFAAYLYEMNESIVTGLQFTSELIDLLTTDLRPHVIIWCRYSDRKQDGPDALTLDLTTQLASMRGVPVLHVWGPEFADRVWSIVKHLEDT